MSETLKKVRLDEVLGSWPEGEKSASDWDEMAQATVSRLESGDRGTSVSYLGDEDLLSAPLGQFPEDGHNSAASIEAASLPSSVATSGTAGRAEGKPMTMPADRERDRRSLQDLAKMAQMTPPPHSAAAISAPASQNPVLRGPDSQKDDSGIVDLAAAAASDPHAADRAQATPLASQGLFDDEPVVARQPVPSLPPVPASVPPPSAAIPSAPAPVSIAQTHVAQPAPQNPQAPIALAPLAPKPAKKGSGAAIALVFGGLVAVSAAAAGTFMVLRTAPVPPPVAAAAKTEAPVAKPEPVKVAEATPTPAAPSDGTDLSALPAAEDPKAPAKPAAGRPAAGGPARVATAATPKAPDTAKLAEKDLPPTPTGPAGALGEEMAKSVGANGATPTPAAGANNPQFAAGSVPQKPSQGAVTGALGAVLGQARGCLGPDDPVSHASVVFGSDGSVQSVSVSGAAAGKPAEACIKSALQRAKLSPFAEPTYTARITVRHN